MQRPFIMLTAMAVLLAGCEKPGQNAYNASEVGVSRAVEFGTVLSVREVDIVGKTNKTGMLAGGATGGVAGSEVGSGKGQILGIIAGAVGGAVAGDFIEQKIRDSKGYEYVLDMRSGKTKTITLEKIDGDEVFKPGDKVMLQTCDTTHKSKCKSGDQFQRLARVDAFPPEQHHKKKVVYYKKVDDDDEEEEASR